MKKKVIVHFSQDFAPGKVQLGGYSRVTNICKDGNGHIIFTVSNKHIEIAESSVPNILVRSFPLHISNFGRFQQIKLLRRIGDDIIDYLNFENINPDLLFGHSQLFNFAVLYYVNKKLKNKIPLIWEANVIWGIHKVRGLKGNIVNRFNKFLQKRVFDLADHLVVQTVRSQEFISTFYKISPVKIAIIRNAINTSDVLSARLTFPIRKLNYSRVLCLGLFDEMNGIPFLIRFIKEHKVSDFQFYFIGEGKYRPQVEALASNGLCYYLGSMPYTQMQLEYVNYDFIIIPRLAQLEADLFIPTKLIEAMYHGLIPLCSRVKSIEDIVHNDVTGFLFEPEDPGSLLSLLEKVNRLAKPVLEEISQRAMEQIVANYNWQSNHIQLNGLYESLTNKQ